jgi:hypothetical protein
MIRTETNKHRTTYIIVVQVAVHFELVETDGSLEGVDECPLRDASIGPHIDPHLWQLIGIPVHRRGRRGHSWCRSRRQNQGKFLWNQYTRFHRESR